MKTAILIDGGFFIKRYQKLSPVSRTHSAKDVAKYIFEYALSDLAKNNKREDVAKRELYRIFFYDCPPLDKKIRNPVSKKEIDLSKSNTAIFRRELHDELRKKRKVALRLGKIATYGSWKIKESILKGLISGKINITDLQDSDVTYNMTQKGVDMKLGLDISSLAYEGKVDQIILIAGDSDFVPAAKMARRAGIDFILDPMWHKVSSDLYEHIDGIVSSSCKPSDIS